MFFIPDFTALPENGRPTVVVILRDISDGSILVPNTIEYRYNDLLLTFDNNGLSTNSGMVGYFKKIDAYSTTIGGATYKVPALRVMRILYPYPGMTMTGSLFQVLLKSPVPLSVSMRCPRRLSFRNPPVTNTMS